MDISDHDAQEVDEVRLDPEDVHPKTGRRREVESFPDTIRERKRKRKHDLFRGTI